MTVMTLLHDISVFEISDKAECELRLQKNPPNLIIADAEFLQSTHDVLKESISHPDRVNLSFIVLGKFSQKDSYLDEMMIGRIQFFETDLADNEWLPTIKKSFKFSFESKAASFQIKILKANDFLMKTGDPADKVFILKKGKLQAFQQNHGAEKIVFGDIEPGEFVGEMAYFNSEPRSACVIALEDSELIEIPIASFERTIYSKPAWSMKLIETLSKRLKKFNQKS